MRENRFPKRKNTTSWQPVAGRYNQNVGEKGSYYHQHLILPNSLKLLELKKGSSILDLGCGQGVLARQIPKDVEYQGFDLSRDLIKSAQSLSSNSWCRFGVADITNPLPLDKRDFTHCVVMLALQNVESMDGVMENAKQHLGKGGKILLVLNHPCFRIPRQTSWGEDKENKQQYRMIFRYRSFLKIPVNMTPGGKKSTLTWSFHHPISDIVESLSVHGFCIDKMEEWYSDKESAGNRAKVKMENRARAEIPLFMAILAIKK